MTVALYMGSFNPLHYGHLAIAEYLCKCEKINEVRLIVSPKNPLKEASILSESHSRLDAARSTITDEIAAGRTMLRKLIVSDIEFSLPSPTYTIHTINHLQKQEPSTNFVLVIGGDNLGIFKNWYKWEEILEKVEVWIYPRPGYEIQKDLEELESIPNKKGLRYLADAPLYDISSTQIRDSLPR